MSDLPTRKEWQTFRDGYGIEQGAVSGLNIGQALEDYHKKESRDFAKNKKYAEAAAKALKKYRDKLKATQITKAGKNLNGFKAELNAKYIAKAEQIVVEMGELTGDLDSFLDKIDRLVTAANSLAHGMTSKQLKTWYGGPGRGPGATASKVKGFDYKGMQKAWQRVDEWIDEITPDTPQNELDDLVDEIQDAVTKTANLADALR